MANAAKKVSTELMSRRDHYHHRNNEKPGHSIDTKDASCSFGALGAESKANILGTGAWLSDQAFNHLDLSKTALTPDGQAIMNKFGCLEISASNHDIPLTHSKPTIQDMINQAARLNKFVSGDRDALPFEVEEISEYEFKKRYYREVRRQRERIAPNLPVADLDRLNKGLYAVEDPDGTFDTQAGTMQDYARSEDPDAYKTLRRNLPNPASTGVGYCQILTPTALHLMLSDNGQIAESMRLNAGEMTDKQAAVMLQEKAKWFESVQDKLRTQLHILADKDKQHYKDYFDDEGNPTEKLCWNFWESLDKASVGMTNKELAVAAQGLLLDGDIGPIVQGRQLGADLKDAQGKAAQEYFSSKASSWEQSRVMWDKMPADAQEKAILSYIKQLRAANLEEDERSLLASKASELGTSRLKEAPANASAPAEPAACDALLNAPKVRGSEDIVQRTLLGMWCTPEYLVKQGLATVVQFYNNFGPDNADRMLSKSKESTAHFLGLEALRANSIVQNANTEEVLARIRQRQKQVSYGTKQFDQISQEFDKEKPEGK
jgi:hypothetical protein